MNLYLILPSKRLGYDAYGGAVVAAPNEDTAARMHPSDGSFYGDPDKHSLYTDCWGQLWDWRTNTVLYKGTVDDWCKPWEVKVEFVGVAAEGTKCGVVLAQFNAG